MSDWIGLGIFVLVIAGAVVGLSFLGKERPPMSAEEFEKRAAEARGTTAGAVSGIMYALQKIMNPKAAEAVEVQKDLRAGFYNDESGKGEGDDDEGEGAARNEDEPGLKRKDRELTVEEDAEDEDDKDDA